MSFRKFLDPKNDIAFKRIFGEERNKDILLGFLNDALAKQTGKISNIKYIATIQIPEVARERVSIVDIMCQDEHGKNFIVEMQVVSGPEYLKRAQYYAARAYIKQRTREIEYKDLKEVIFLAICNQSILTSHKEYISYHQMLELNTYERHLKEFSFTFIELEKFNKQGHELKSNLDKWVYFLKHAEEADEIPLPEELLDNPNVNQAIEEIKSYNWTNAELEAYEQIDFEHETYLSKMAEFRAEGKAEGKAESTVEMANNLLSKGIPLDVIAASANLTVKELQDLIQNQSS